MLQEAEAVVGPGLEADAVKEGAKEEVVEIPQVMAEMAHPLPIFQRKLEQKTVLGDHLEAALVLA